MTIEALSFINDELEALSIPYEFGEWDADEVPDPYFVGDYVESDSQTREENGFHETNFILTGTGTSRLALENVKTLIEKNISKTKMLENGSIAIFYSNAFYIPTGDANLKRLQINLDIKEWSVN